MRDIRYACRLLIRDRRFTLVAIVALALGIGANTAIFSVVNAALVRPLPYRDASRLAVVWDQLSKLGLHRFPVSYANYLDYKAANRVFEDVAAFSPGEFNLTLRDRAERVPGVRVSANLLSILGAGVIAGRTFTAEDNQPARGSTAIISDTLWRGRFGGDPKVVGQTLMLDGSGITVVGILFPFLDESSARNLDAACIAVGPGPDRRSARIDRPLKTRGFVRTSASRYENGSAHCRAAVPPLSRAARGRRRLRRHGNGAAR